VNSPFRPALPRLRAGFLPFHTVSAGSASVAFMIQRFISLISKHLAGNIETVQGHVLV
jgi:hypothetical protein